MSEQELRRRLVRAWVGKAEDDLAAAQALLVDREQFLQIIGFLCQQSAEKMLKAFLQHAVVDFPKTHNLLELLNLCSTVDARLGDLAAAADRLNPLSVSTRYPDIPPLVAPEEADEVISLAQQVRAAVYARLPDTAA